jgi:orotidine-5'-phosphate decarboxylase
MDRTGSIACVGLDPRPDLVPPSLRGPGGPDDAAAVAAAFVELNGLLLAAIAGRCAAVKPQVACYEAYGAPGWAALADTVRLAHEAGIEVIVDGKRGDIGSTAAHYAQAMFGGAPSLGGPPLAGLGADWATVNGYLGGDNVLEFLRDDRTQGVFVLAKTSNPTSGELQDVELSTGGTVAHAVAELVHAWGNGRRGTSGLTDVGAVVGATYPEQARALRTVMPDAMFLVPGYGSQGGDAAGALAGARHDGRGVLVSSSRGVMGAWQSAPEGTDWLDASRTALDDMNAALTAAHP